MGNILASGYSHPWLDSINSWFGASYSPSSPLYLVVPGILGVVLIALAVLLFIAGMKSFREIKRTQSDENRGGVTVEEAETSSEAASDKEEPAIINEPEELSEEEKQKLEEALSLCRGVGEKGCSSLRKEDGRCNAYEGMEVQKWRFPGGCAKGNLSSAKPKVKRPDRNIHKRGKSRSKKVVK